MNKIINLQHRQEESLSIDDEAREWVVRLDGDDVIDEDYGQFRQWLEQGEAQRNAFRHHAELWGSLDLMMRELPDRKPDAHRFKLASNIPEQAFAWRPFMGIAASILLGALVVFSFWLSGLQHQDYQRQLATQVGGIEHVALPDGSDIRLNTQTTTNVHYSETARVVHLLEGEAHFDIAHDPGKPFVVYVGGVGVRAVGTAFSVHLGGNDEVEVTVTEGQVVLFSAPDMELGGDVSLQEHYAGADLGSLIEGQHMLVSERETQVKNLPADKIEKKLSWREGMLVFEEDPLKDVIRQVSRYTETKIQITDPSVESLKIDGYFPAGKIEVLLSTLEDSFGIQVTRSDEHSIQLSR